MLYLDIGIDLGGSMQPILFKGDTSSEYELKLAPMNEQKEIEVCFYEGQRALVKDNQLLGKILLTHNEKIGPFVVDLHIENQTLILLIEKNVVETFQLSNEATSFFILKESDQFLEIDKVVKEREKERQELKEYIYGTLHTLKEIDPIIDKTPILNIMYKAEDVSYMEDITLQEIRDVQIELEGNINLFMNRVKKMIN